jgi:copper chaperone CopZ
MKFIKLMMLTILYIMVTSQQNYAQNNSQISDSIKTITVKVKGLTCAGDLKTIAANVEKLSGVNTCKTGKMGAISSFKVTYNTTKVSAKEINAAIENTSGCENPNDRPYKVK